MGQQKLVWFFVKGIFLVSCIDTSIFRKKLNKTLSKNGNVQIISKYDFFNININSVSFALIGIRLSTRALQFTLFQNPEGHRKSDTLTEEHMEKFVFYIGCTTT